jgi:hypothetical protein
MKMTIQYETRRRLTADFKAKVARRADDFGVGDEAPASPEPDVSAKRQVVQRW